MTRKRFIKKMMALGYSRNEANATAARARRYGMSYAARWEYENRPIRSLIRTAGGVGKVLRRAGKTFAKAAIEAAGKAAAIFAIPPAFLPPTAYEREWLKFLESNPPVRLEIDPIQAATKVQAASLQITDVSLVPSGGVPLNYGQNCDGLRIHYSFVDELDASGPALTNEQIKATTAKWPGGTAVLVGIDMADGPDVAAQIHVAGGADNAD